MSFFKRFSDVLLGFCTLCGIVEILRKYMSYEFPEDEVLGTLEKVKLFLSPDASGEPRHFALFVALMVCALIIGRLFDRLPLIPLFVSSLPFFHSIVLFFYNRLGETPLFFVLCMCTGFVGALYDSLRYDTQNDLALTHHAAAAFGTAFAAFTFIFSRVAVKYAALATIMPSAADERSRLVADSLELVGVNLFFSTSAEELDLMKLLFKLIVISLLLSYLLRGAYFIDLIFSGAIFVLVCTKWHAGVLLRAESPIIALALIYFIIRLGIFFAEPEPRSIIKRIIEWINVEKTTAED